MANPKSEKAMTPEELKAYMAQYQKERRARLKEEHRCVYCQRQDWLTLKGKSACCKCMAQRVEDGRIRRQNKRAEEKEREEQEMKEQAKEMRAQTAEQTEGKRGRPKSTEKVIITRYYVFARRSAAEEWSEWAHSESPEMAAKQYWNAKHWGLDARIEERKIKTKLVPKQRTNEEIEQEKAECQREISRLQQTTLDMSICTIDEDRLTTRYVDLAGAIMKEVCREYEDLVTKINNKRVKDKCSEDTLIETASRIEGLERYLLSPTCGTLSLNRGKEILQEVKRRIHKKLVEKKKIHSEDIIWNMDDLDAWLEKRAAEKSATDGTNHECTEDDLEGVITPILKEAEDDLEGVIAPNLKEVEDDPWM